MKIPVKIGVYAEFECIIQSQDNPKMQFTQHAIAIGYFKKSQFGNHHYLLLFGTDFGKWFEDRILELKKNFQQVFRKSRGAAHSLCNLNCITVHLQAKSPQTLYCACMSSDSADMS